MTPKVEKRIKANRIFAYLPIRDHFGSFPGRMQCDLCGHPLFYWALKAAAEAKHVEKVVVWTEMKNAKEVAAQISDRIIVLKRTLEECKEPMHVIVDDLKTPKSKVWRYSSVSQPEKFSRALDFEPTFMVMMAANLPLIRPEAIDRMIERFFEDDEAETVTLVHRTSPPICRQDPLFPQYLLTVLGTIGINRQLQEPVYEARGALGWVVSQHVLGQGRFHMGRMVFWEVPWEDTLDVHKEEDLELARFYMEKRLKDEAI